MWNKYPDVKKGGAGWALFGKKTGSRHPKRQRAILWHRGSGLGHRDDSYLQNRRLANFWFRRMMPRSHVCDDSIGTEITAWKIRKGVSHFASFDWLQKAAEKSFARGWVCWIHVWACSCKWRKSVGATLGDHLANPSAVHSRCWWRLNWSAT